MRPREFPFEINWLLQVFYWTARGQRAVYILMKFTTHRLFQCIFKRIETPSWMGTISRTINKWNPQCIFKRIETSFWMGIIARTINKMKPTTHGVFQCIFKRIKTPLWMGIISRTINKMRKLCCEELKFSCQVVNEESTPVNLILRVSLLWLHRWI